MFKLWGLSAQRHCAYTKNTQNPIPRPQSLIEVGGALSPPPLVPLARLRQGGFCGNWKVWDFTNGSLTGPTRSINWHVAMWVLRWSESHDFHDIIISPSHIFVYQYVLYIYLGDIVCTAYDLV